MSVMEDVNGLLATEGTEIIEGKLKIAFKFPAYPKFSVFIKCIHIVFNSVISVPSVATCFKNI